MVKMNDNNGRKNKKDGGMKERRKEGRKEGGKKRRKERRREGRRRQHKAAVIKTGIAKGMDI
jgi:hypothetical protein